MRVCCYGSSSSNTPERYLDESYKLGTILSKRGHVCVNGAGRTGCMGAMNKAVHDNNGHVIGVIHEMFLEKSATRQNPVGDENDGAHFIFKHCTGDEDEVVRKLFIAGGDDLQERKKMLFENADCLCVMPGGCGTWDELWEMACSKSIGLITMPIVVVNVDNFYTPFQNIMIRAFKEKLLYREPDDIIRFESNAEDAIKWLEMKYDEIGPQTQRERSNGEKSSQSEQISGIDDSFMSKYLPSLKLVFMFSAGVTVGSIISFRRKT